MFENKISVPCLTAYILTLTEKLKKKVPKTHSVFINPLKSQYQKHYFAYG